MSEGSGYKKPPEHTRFRKGQSGNPRGRPKGSGMLLPDLQAELRKTITVTENGRRRTFRKQQALMTALTNAAIKGDTKAAALILTWMTRLIERDPAAKPQQGVTAAERQIIEDHLNLEAELRAAKLKEDGL